MARLRQFIGNIVKNISMDDPYVLQILDPWSLMYGEYEDDFIEVLRQRIGPKHPLYNREVYAVAIRRDPEATLFHAYNDGFYAIVYFSAVPRGRPGMPKTVSTATALANNLPKLAELRAGLRQRMSRSPLMDSMRFAADIEQAFRLMWTNWCRSVTTPTEI